MKSLATTGLISVSMLAMTAPAWAGVNIGIRLDGGSRYYDNAGHLVLKDPGSIRFQLLIDYNGTPGDPEDDVDLDFNVIRESTGRTDTNGRDFCNDVLIFSAA